jgi:hypothetical protein
MVSNPTSGRDAGRTRTADLAPGRSALTIRQARGAPFGHSACVSTKFNNAREGIAFTIVIFVRRIALWLLIPVTVVLWGVLTPVRWLAHRRSRPSLGQYVTWADLTCVAVLERGPLRPLVSCPEPFPKWPTERANPPYRVGISDLA